MDSQTWQKNRYPDPRDPQDSKQVEPEQGNAKTSYNVLMSMSMHVLKI